MAVSKTTDNVGNSAGRQEKLKDEYIDLQYAKPQTTADEYTQEPWKHYEDPLDTFLSLRVDDRPEFQSKLEPKHQDRVRHEEQRIARIRKQFSSNQHKGNLMQELRNSKKAWKDEVGKNAGKFIQEAENFLFNMRNARPNALLDDPAFFREFCERAPQASLVDVPQWLVSRILDELAPVWQPKLDHKYQRYIARFQRLKSWETSTTEVTKGPELPPTNRAGLFRVRSPSRGRPTQLLSAAAAQQNARPRTSSEETISTDNAVEPEPFYGLKAGVIYFRKVKDKETWVGCNSHHPKFTGDFPNQKISMHEIFDVDKPDGNPLMQKCPPDEIRYFHFPTNNMIWIEVSCQWM